MSEEAVLPKSTYKMGNKRLDELTHAELLEGVETLWQAKNEEITKLKAARARARRTPSTQP